jgi:hypothetical protein
MRVHILPEQVLCYSMYHGMHVQRYVILYLAMRYHSAAIGVVRYANSTFPV